MPVKVIGPDGATYQFPDGTDKAAAVAYFKKKGIGVQAKAPAPFVQPPKKGFLKSFAAPFVGAVKSLDPRPTDDERAQGLTSGYDYVMRPLERVVEGGIDQGRQAVSEFKQSAPTSMHPTPEQLSHRQLATGHALATVIPVLGPWAASVAEEGGEQLGTGDYSGAAGTVAGNAVLALAPKVVKEGTRALSPRLRTAAQSMVGAGEKPVKAIVAKEADGANTAYDAARRANQKATEETLEDRAKVDEANARQRAQEAQKRLEARAANHAADKTHAKATEVVRAANKEAVRAQEKIALTREKLTSASRELQAQIETARNNAQKEGDAKYNTVNEKLNPIAADPEFYTKSLVDASESIKGSAPEPTFLRAIEKRIETGDPIRYEDLQADYSRLGRELSKGTLPGDVYHAYDQMHEAIGEEMQRIADAHGQGPQLTAARNYWRRMKQAFGKPYNPTDVGNTVLDKATGQGTAEEQANRVRLLGSFDKTIPQTVEHIGNLREGLGALPDPKPIRDVVKPLPAKPEPAPLPKPGEPKPYSEPRPTTPVERPEVNTRAVREQLVDRFAHGEEKLNPFQVRALIRGGIGPVIGAALGEHFGGVGTAVGAIAGTALGPLAIAKLLDVPGVREWLTRPPAGELETLRNLPSADRLRITDTLGKVVEQSAKMGKPIKVSPAVMALIVGTRPLAPRQHPSDEWSQPQR